MLGRKQLYPQLIAPLGSVPRVRGMIYFFVERKVFNSLENLFLPVSGMCPLLSSYRKRNVGYPFTLTNLDLYYLLL